MRGQIRGLDMASKNAQDGVSLLQTAKGALNETQINFNICVNYQYDIATDEDRLVIQEEVDQLVQEIQEFLILRSIIPRNFYQVHLGVALLVNRNPNWC
jgi:flagellin-like hook-associated protein FlgL